MTTPDEGLAARLDELQAKATDDDLSEQGHYFGDCGDLTQCSHGDCGYFPNRHDGPFIAAIWNAYRSGQLITLADHERLGKEAAEAEREACALEADATESWIRGASEIAAAIRARGVTG